MDFGYYFSLLVDVDTFSMCLIGVFVGAICWFIVAVGERTGVAIICTPFLILGGLLANLYYRMNGANLSADTDTNLATATSIGVLITLIFLMIAAALIVMVRDKLFARRQRNGGPGAPLGN